MSIIPVSRFVELKEEKIIKLKELKEKERIDKFETSIQNAKLDIENFTLTMVDCDEKTPYKFILQKCIDDKGKDIIISVNYVPEFKIFVDNLKETGYKILFKYYSKGIIVNDTSFDKMINNILEWYIIRAYTIVDKEKNVYVVFEMDKATDLLDSYFQN